MIGSQKPYPEYDLLRLLISLKSCRSVLLWSDWYWKVPVGMLLYHKGGKSKVELAREISMRDLLVQAEKTLYILIIRFQL